MCVSHFVFHQTLTHTHTASKTHKLGRLKWHDITDNRRTEKRASPSLLPPCRHSLSSSSHHRHHWSRSNVKCVLDSRTTKATDTASTQATHSHEHEHARSSIFTAPVTLTVSLCAVWCIKRGESIAHRWPMCRTEHAQGMSCDFIAFDKNANNLRAKCFPWRASIGSFSISTTSQFRCVFF